MPHDSEPIQIAIAGLGGFAATIATTVLEHGPQATPPAKLVAVCDPSPQSHAERVDYLNEQGVVVENDFNALIAMPEVDAVWLPVPIDLHVPFAKAALAAGKAVVIEKPVAGTVDELDELIEARDASGLPVFVGFQDIYDPNAKLIKQRLLNGDLGAISNATLHACWPRTAAYFGRNQWAGKLRCGDSWVLDSPANNALSHFVNLGLFLLGPSEQASATPVKIEAELYRAARIENYDTASIRVHTAEGPEFLINLTHAVDTLDGPHMRFNGEHGSVKRVGNDYVVEDRDGETFLESDGLRYRHLLDRLGHRLRGLNDEDATSYVASLEIARAQTIVINAVSEAAAVCEVPEEYVEEKPHDQSTIRSIPGIDEAFVKCAQQNMMLHETGLLAFTQPAVTRVLDNYNSFTGPNPQTLVPTH